MLAVPADYHPDPADSGADHRPDDLQPQKIEEKRDPRAVMLENPGKRPGRDEWVAPVKRIIDKSPPDVENNCTRGCL